MIRAGGTPTHAMVSRKRVHELGVIRERAHEREALSRGATTPRHKLHPQTQAPPTKPHKEAGEDLSRGARGPRQVGFGQGETADGAGCALMAAAAVAGKTKE